MLPPHPDRSIRNIPVSTSHRHATPEHPMNTQQPRAGSGRMKYFFILLSVVAVCGIGGLLLSTVFEGASITVYPKVAVVTPPSSITAALNAPKGSLGYQLLSVTQSATTSVAATGMQHVQKEASGTIVIHNSFSTAPQRLIANTRFEAPNGSIYRIHDSVMVPGATKQADGTLAAGSVSTTLFADAPGATYNTANQTQFTIPGFKKDPRYTKFTAEAQGAIGGGFVGDRPAVSAGDLAKATATLQTQLQTSITAAANSHIPSGFIAIPSSLTITYTPADQTPGDNNTALISETANSSMAIIKSADLAGELAKELVSGYAGEAVDFSDPTKVAIAAATTTKATVGPINLMLSGTPSIVWQFDASALKQMLLGRDKESFEGIVKTFQPAIIKASASIRPFWKATFPSDPGKLQVTIAQ